MDQLGSSLGKTLIVTGLLILICGILISFVPKLPWLDKLPGNIYIKRGNLTLYLPLTTCILVSLVLTLLLKLFRR
jgi:hypothetical protein